MTKELIKNAKYILHTCEKLKESILFGKYELENALLSCYHLSELAGMEEIRNWTKNELEGFGSGDELPAVDDFPTYRKNIYCTISKRGYDSEGEDNKTVYLPFKVSTPRIVQFIKNDKDDPIGFVVTSFYNDIIKSKYHLNGITTEEYTILILKSNMSGILESVKVKLISNLQKFESYANKILEEKTDDVKEQIIEFDPKKIFIVHGRHEQSRNELENILRNKLNLDPIILMDQTNEGKTVIEKFENNSLKIGFTFVILTPDDVGMLKSDFLEVQSDLDDIKKKLKDKARQNVILELGYFTGKLGRKRVCCIQQGEKELLPSDLHGLVTIRFRDSIKETFLDIENELKKAGYLFNLN